MTTPILTTSTSPLPPACPLKCAFSAAQANAEGWGLFDCGVLDDGTPHVELQRLDNPADGELPFPDDGAAWDHVVEQARAGSTLHQGALQMVDTIERCLIEARCGWWPGFRL